MKALSRQTTAPKQRFALTRRQWEMLASYAALIGLSVVIFFPIFNMILASFKPADELFRFPPRLWPQRPSLDAYITAWNSAPLGRFLLNSLLQSSIITAGQLLTSALAGYAFACMRFPGRQWLFGITVATLLIPGEVIVIPNYFTVARLGWLNSMAALTVPFLANGFGIFLMRQFFRTVPQEFFDAARIDGAGHGRFFWYIALPMARPALGALAIFAFLQAWNQYFWPLLVTTSTRMRTAQIGIAIFQNDIEGSEWQVIAAATTLVLLPTLLAFFIAQKQFIRGISLGGLKG